jgi:hypothetical protein
MASRKRYIEQHVFDAYRSRYYECVRMLNGLEGKLELQLDPDARGFPPQVEKDVQGDHSEP